MSEPFTDHLALDVIRCLIAPAAWLLCVLILKLAAQRWRARNADRGRYDDRTHPAAMVSYAILLFFAGFKRADQLGSPFDWYLVPVVVAIIIGYIGVLRRVHVPLTPPWRRGSR